MRVAINCLQVDPKYVGGVTSYVLGLLEGFAEVSNGCQFRVFISAANAHLFHDLRKHDLQKYALRKYDLRNHDPRNHDLAKQGLQEPDLQKAEFRKHSGLDFVEIDDNLLGLKGNLCRAALLSGSAEVYKLASAGLFQKIRERMESESDVLYTPTPVLRCLNHRQTTVLSMHDIQHVHHPEFFSWPARLSRRVTYGLSARHASYLQASSQYTKQDLLHYFRALSPQQVEVIPSGVPADKFAAPAAEDALSRLCGIPGRFLFFPAQLWPHKNHLTLLQALKQIETKHGRKIPLVLTGEKFSAAPPIFQFIAEHSMTYVRHLGKVTFQEMVALYQKAAFVITATLHESSSLPILEAAAAGAPIIASRIPPIEELGQVLQLNLFDPLDVEGLARLIVALWDDGETASVQSAYNRRHISFYSWANTARHYIRFFERIAN